MAEIESVLDVLSSTSFPAVAALRGYLLLLSFSPSSLSSTTLLVFLVEKLSTNCFKMVHLARVKTDSEIAPSANLPFDTLPAPDESDFYTNVYGSHIAVDHLNQNEMPEREMPRQIAARLIKDELSLDGNPKLNLASFVTTYST